MNIEHKILAFDLKAASGDGGTFEGWANAFHNIDAAQEIVAPGAFADTLEQFLANGFIGGLNHDWDTPIGRPVAAREDAKGLYVQGRISDTEHGRDCKILLKDGVVRKMSIGYRVKGDEYLETADDVHAYWKEHKYTPSAEDVAAAQKGARLLTKLHLFEFSPVTVPANTLADITRVKRYDRAELETERDFERAVRDALGLSRRESVSFVLHGFKGLQRDADEATPTEPDPAPLPEPEPAADAPEAATAAVEAAPVVDQAEIRALYASLLTRRAGLLAAR